MDKIEYLNKKINDNKTPYEGPKYLYKYRQFDDYTYDMIENNYVFLCQVKRLDDEEECDAKIDISQIYELETNNLKRECVDQIFQFIKPYMDEDKYELVRSKLYQIMNKNGTIKPNHMLDLSLELREYISNYEIVAPMVNCIVNIPNMLDNPKTKEEVEFLLTQALTAKEEKGVCSLSERNDIDEMWKKYAGNHSGYCIEYDVSDYNFNADIYPVVYQDDREKNVIYQLIGTFIGQLVFKMSYDQIKTDSSQYLQLFLTKNKTKWDYQKEWRLVGNADKKIEAPRIKSIYYAENISKENYNRINLYCKTKGISLKKVVRQNGCL